MQRGGDFADAICVNNFCRVKDETGNCESEDEYKALDNA